MSYRNITPEKKVQVVKDAWASKNIAQVAKKYGVTRDSIYSWMKQAERAMQDHFFRQHPGKSPVSLQEENRVLREQIKGLSKVYHKIAQGREPIPLTEKPPACPKCGSLRVRKSGQVYTKRYGFRQRYSCNNCTHSVYISLKKNTNLQL